LGLVGTFSTTPGGYKHILVVVDKFTKWIEVRALASVTSKEATKFIEDITHHFGVPNRIVTDLGSTFTGAKIPSSTSTMHQWYTHTATAKFSVPMAWSFRASRIESSTAPPNTAPGG
jgi:predicted GH43/DUF377 family glycosyl hydrolase